MVDRDKTYDYERVISVFSDSEIDEMFNDYYKDLRSIPFVDEKDEYYILNLKNYLFYTARKTKIWNKLKAKEKGKCFYDLLSFHDRMFYDIPNTVTSLLNLYHIPTVRLIPKSVYHLNNQIFDENEYYGIPLYYEGRGGYLDNKVLHKWLKEFQLAKQIKIKKDKYIGQLLYKTPNSKHWYNLSEASSGFLQLLPIIFKALEKNELLIEQPELHLHPKLQSKLAEFFVDICRGYYMHIIETHSEHIIRKIQILIARDHNRKKTLGLINNIKVYFLSKDDTGLSSIKEMKLDNLGKFINEWPQGFFDTDTDMALEFFREISRN